MKFAALLISLAGAGFACILEDLRSDVDSLNSTSTQLTRDVIKTDQRLVAVEGELSGMIESVSKQLEEKYNKMKEKVDSNEENQLKLDEKVGSLDSKLDSSHAQLNGKVEQTEEELEKKHEALVGEVGKIESDLDELDDELDKIQEEAEKRLEKLQEDLGVKIEILEGRVKQVEETQSELVKRIEALEGKKDDKKGGIWHLGMNINPSDGHIFGYTVGWATGNQIGSDEEALTKDYLSNGVWDEPANYIAIVRHQQGVADAVKVFKFKHWDTSLYTRFSKKNMNPGRQIVSEGGPIQESIAVNATNMEDDPVFSVGGDLAFNWAFGDNGVRIVLTGGHLSGANENDDNTHGLGNNFYCNPITNTRYGNTRNHDASMIQDCNWLERCRDSQVKVQGTDHGDKYRDGPVYGNYAIYVSRDAATFPLPGSKLDLQIVMN